MATLNATTIDGTLINNTEIKFNQGVWNYGVHHASIPSHYYTKNGVQYYRVARLNGYFNFDVIISGSWSWGAPSLAKINICNRDGDVNIIQLAGRGDGAGCNSIRLSRVKQSDSNLRDTYDVLFYLDEGDSNSNSNALWAQQDFWFEGYGNFEAISWSAAQDFPEYSKVSELRFIGLTGNIITSDSIGSQHVQRANILDDNHQKQIRLIGDESTTTPTGLVMNASDATQRAFIGFLGNTNNNTNSETQLQISTNYGDIQLKPATNKVRILGDEVITENWRGTLPNVTANRADHSNYSDNNIFHDDECSLGTGSSKDVYINYRNGRYGQSSGNTGIVMYRFMNRNAAYADIMTYGYHHSQMDSNDYVLTAGGSYKSIRDFHLKSNLLFSYSNGVLSITKS